MLNRLLELVRSGGTHRIVDLARELDTTPVLVEAMLEELTRMGHLKHVRGECASGCGQCPMAGLCAAGQGGAIWALVEKEQEE